MSEHSDIIGGSSAGRVIACPGSVGLNQKVKVEHKRRILVTVKEDFGLSDMVTLENAPAEIKEEVERIYRHETTSSYAEEGTALHEAIAWILEEDASPEEVVDRKFNDHYITANLYSDTILPVVQQVEDFIEQLYEEDCADGGEVDLYVEQKCEFPGVEGAFGTVDLFMVTPKRIVVWDHKFGAGVPVPVEGNAQLKFYGLGAVNTVLGNKDYPDDYPVTMVIAQPRYGDGQPQIAHTNMGELYDFEEEVLDAIEAAQDEDPSFAQGDHCRWCDGKHVCPVQEKTVNQMATLMEERVEKAKAENPKATTKQAISSYETEYTPDDLAQWLEDADLLEAWVKHVRTLAYNELHAGRPVPGHKLVLAYGNRKWTLPDDDVEKRLGRYKVPLEKRRVTKPMSPTQALAFFKGDKKKIDLLNKIIERPINAPKMVGEDAKGDPYVPSGDAVADLGKAMDKLK